MAIEFPRKLWEADHDWNVVGNTITSGVTTAGPVDTRSDGGGYWSASLNNIRFIDRTYTLLWRAVRQLCATRPIVVGRRDETFAPFPDGFMPYDPISHSDGALFDDGTGYYQPIIDVETYGDAQLRATTLFVQLNVCGDLLGGESFTIDHPTRGPRLYEIETVEYIDDTHAKITFGPLLREDVPAGTKLDFDRPRCTMKLLNASSMDLNTTTYPFSLAIEIHRGFLMVLADAELDALEGGSTRTGYFFRLETDPVVRIWLGVGDIKPGVNALDPDGVLYQGLGEISTLPAMKQLLNGAAERVEFSVSGVQGDLLRIASSGDAEQVKSKRVSVGFALMDQDWQLLGSVKWIRTYTADYLGVQQQVTDDPSQPIIRTITLSCGSLLTARRRPSLSYFSNQDQQSRYPDDLFCERTPVYANQFNKEWPRFDS